MVARPRRGGGLRLKRTRADDHPGAQSRLRLDWTARKLTAEAQRFADYALHAILPFRIATRARGHARTSSSTMRLHSERRRERQTSHTPVSRLK